MKKFNLSLAALMLIFGAAFAQTTQAERDFLKDMSCFVENLDVFEAGQEEGRAYHIPEHNKSLNGTWKFSYYETPGDVPSDFYKPGFSDRRWDSIEVPSNWEMQGFGQALFRNCTAPFPLEPPKAIREQQMRRFMQFGRGGQSRPAPLFSVEPPSVPMDHNPTGAYRTTFTIPSTWTGENVFLRFEKVASASFIWVNGQQVGYNEGAQEPSEYNITKYLKKGTNTLAVLVLKYSDGYYLEGQDYWRLAGIFDDVTLYAAPQVRIYDWQLITDFDNSFTDSQLSIAVDVKSYDATAGDYSLKAAVSKDGRKVAEMSSGSFGVKADDKLTLKLSTLVKSPDKWTAETPSLYDLSLELSDASGKVIDHIGKKMGFKKTEIIDGVFYLNGVAIKVNAQNSHMQHPELGHAMDEETIRKDMTILKQFGFNAVRTSHYPPVNEYLDLADEYGLYIIDETGDEAHASEYVSTLPEWIPMYKERVRQMVLRDRNHPCVLFWSAGNESGEGDNITEVVKEGKSLDPTRFWMYGGNAAVHPGEDIVGPRYPSPLEHEMRYGRNPADKRPSFMDEYLSVAGNGGGAMDDFWRVIYSHPSLMGGALWDFVSPGITQSIRELEDKSPYGTQSVIMGNAKLVPGPTGKAIDLNKQDQWVQVYRDDNVEITGDRLSLTLDVFPRKFNKSGGYLLTKGSYQYGLKQHGADSLDFYIDTGTMSTLTVPLPSDWENKWHNVTAVYDGAKMEVFIDKHSRGSMEKQGRIRNLPFSVCVGRDENALGQETNVYICDALIDNVGIFADALKPSDSFDVSKAALWLDFESENTTGTFYSYGIGARTYGSIWPDRVPQPEMWQMKKSTQPLSFTLVDESGWLEIWNRGNFLNADHYKTTWSLYADDELLDSGELDLDVEANAYGKVKIPLRKPAIVPGKEYRVDISSVLRSDEIWAPAGFEMAWDQFELSSWNIPAAGNAPAGTVSVIENDDRIIVSGDGFRYAFDSVSGTLVSMTVDGQELLCSPLRLNLWRAPLANESDGWNSGSVNAQNRKQGYGGIGHESVIASSYYSYGLDKIQSLPIDVSFSVLGDAAVLKVRELSILGSEEGQLDTYIRGMSYSGFENIYQYRIFGDGTIKLDHEIKPQGNNLPEMLPRIGLSTSFIKSLDNVEWYGRGPQANYPDRKSGYRVGIFSSKVRDMYEPYLIPQDYGLRTDNRWVQLTDDTGRGVLIDVDEPFNFNIYPFTTENLTKAVYTYQLRESDSLTFNLDYATSGVGCTARGIFNAYRVLPAAYERSITIKPLR